MPENKNYKELLKQLEESGFEGLTKKHKSLDFRDLMKFRVEKILMVSSLYDYYTIVEDGHLQEAIFNEYIEMNLYYAPVIRRSFKGKSAIEMIRNEDYDMVIANLRLGDMDLNQFCRQVKEIDEDLPVYLLASQSQELVHLKKENQLELFDRVFIWNGDRRVLLAIIKQYEDKINAPEDCIEHGVTGIILVEDSPEFYSSFLPLLYTEVMNQSQRLIVEGMNSAEKMLRQRARPKIFLADNYEDALSFYKDYHNTLLGIITDLAFPVDGKKDFEAGIKLVKQVKEENPALPMLLQSSQKDKRHLAEENNIYFIDKNSQTLLKDIRGFILKNFGFGDFSFKLPNGEEIARAHDISDFIEKLKTIPEESLLYHSKYNHISYWFIARTEFELANKVRPVHINMFGNAEELRLHLIQLIKNQLDKKDRGVIKMFSKEEFDRNKVLQMVGQGSFGGKARGLAFIEKILNDYLDNDYFEKINIKIPKTFIIGTDVFSDFLEMNDLYEIAFGDHTNREIIDAFQKAEFPDHIREDLNFIIKRIHYPIAVRSSSLLEDAMYQPFAGVYSTVIIPNSCEDEEIRFHNLVQAIKYIYASTFFKKAKNYLEATGNRMEEEQMGVILQQLVGDKHDNYYYPHFSGVIRSYNYYPFGKATPQDGIVKLALGLGKTIVDSGVSLQYSPKYPTVYPQFGTMKDMLNKSQTNFWALDLNCNSKKDIPGEDIFLKDLRIEKAEKHGTLPFIASTYDPENDMVYQGLSKDGPRILNFAPILKSKIIPLNDVIKVVSKIAEIALNSPVEIEFAVKINEGRQVTADFVILQVRPMVKPEGFAELKDSDLQKNGLLLSSDSALGNGIYETNYILFVKPDTFDASKTQDIAMEISKINNKLVQENKNYMLIGPGRWGTSDPWLGIPVNFSDIAGAKILIETKLKNMNVEASQGSHFFHNMTSFKIGYLNINNKREKNHIDWEWLMKQDFDEETEHIALINTQNSVNVTIDGQKRLGIAKFPNSTKRS